MVAEVELYLFAVARLIGKHHDTVGVLMDCDYAPGQVWIRSLTSLTSQMQRYCKDDELPVFELDNNECEYIGEITWDTVAKYLARMN